MHHIIANWGCYCSLGFHSNKWIDWNFIPSGKSGLTDWDGRDSSVNNFSFFLQGFMNLSYGVNDECSNTMKRWNMETLWKCCTGCVLSRQKCVNHRHTSFFPPLQTGATGQLTSLKIKSAKTTLHLKKSPEWVPSGFGEKIQSQFCSCMSKMIYYTTLDCQ